MKHTPIIQQCLDRLNESLQSVDAEGYVKLRAESAIMIHSWLERLDDAVVIYKLTQQPVEDYVSDRVFEGKRPLSPERSAMLREKYMKENAKLIGHTRKSPLHAPDLSLYRDEKTTYIRVNKYNPSNIYLQLDNRTVPQLIELLKESMNEH